MECPPPPLGSEHQTGRRSWSWRRSRHSQLPARHNSLQEATMSERGIKWACKYCTYKNWPSAIKCTMCGAQKPTGIIAEDPFKSDSSDIGRDWDPSSTELCYGLCYVQTLVQDQGLSLGTAWKMQINESCHMCTYLNWPRTIRCTQYLSQRKTRSPTESPQSSGFDSRQLLFLLILMKKRNKLNTRTQHWTCSICTYENWATPKKCVIIPDLITLKQ